MAVGASAATTSYRDATAFAGAAGSLSREGFDTAGFGSVIGPERDFGAFTTHLRSSLSMPQFNFIGDQNSLNGSRLNGLNLQVGLLEGETFTFRFKQAITAFGAVFSGVNNGIWDGNNFRSLARRASLRVAGVVMGAEGTNAWLGQTRGRATRFFGIVSETPFYEVTFTGLFDTEGMGIDDVQWASASTPTPVPVPASGVLLLGAVAAAGFVARRKARG
ncbi:hypothetical protein C0V75_12485 [Tabrizicola sp. TH137]|uniref:hypothetical protein n=1 Tax=Tabrizicola sp. TH137 TaxID=2067452 RepID=UPI000C79FDE4|nr:hypothetical protein [Tabrizicola sp. TH137]PLL12723.1 hypothetical protein C0V75_12485 [Tabrizicola sp. TH137]